MLARHRILPHHRIDTYLVPTPGLELIERLLAPFRLEGVSEARAPRRRHPFEAVRRVLDPAMVHDGAQLGTEE